MCLTNTTNGHPMEDKKTENRVRLFGRLICLDCGGVLNIHNPTTLRKFSCYCGCWMIVDVDTMTVDKCDPPPPVKRAPNNRRFFNRNYDEKKEEREFWYSKEGGYYGPNKIEDTLPD